MKHAPIHWPALRGGLCDLGLGEPEISWISLGELATVRGWPGGSSFIDPALGRRKTPKGTAAAVSATLCDDLSTEWERLILRVSETR